MGLADSCLAIRDRVFTARQQALVRMLSASGLYTLVNEFPKSGGTWLAQMLSDALEIPFRRNEPLRIERSLAHGHFLDPRFLSGVVVLWRDPRDVLVSLYHHCYFVSEHGEGLFGNAKIVARMKQRQAFADYDDVRANLPRFIDFVSTTPLAPRFSWPRFAAVWARRNGVVETSYEALRSDTTAELSRVVEALSGRLLDPDRVAAIADARSFARVRAAAEATLPATAERSFVREGSVGGWRAHFSDDALAALERHGYRAGMEKLGYAL